MAQRTRGAQQNYLRFRSSSHIKRTVQLGVSTRGTSKASSSVTAVSTTVAFLQQGVTTLVTSTIRLQQLTLTLIQSQWGLGDAYRRLNRLAEQNYALDTRRAQVSSQLAHRQYLIAQRTGRQLDVQSALIDMEIADREVIRGKRQEEDKEREALRGVISATLEYNIAQKEVDYFNIQLFFNMSSMIIAMGGYVSAIVAVSAARAAEQATTKFKTRLPLAGAALGAGLAGYIFGKAMGTKPDTSAMGLAQTKTGDIREVKETGPAILHKGEIIARPETLTKQRNNSTTINIDIYAGHQSSNEIANMVVRRIKNLMG